jgi:signal transduction histidine kinase
MIVRIWPRSLAARTALVLLTGLALVQVAGLTIHAFDRLQLQRLSQTRDLAQRAINIYRSIALAEPDERETVLQEFDLRDGATVRIGASPPATDMPSTNPEFQHELRVDMQFVPIRGGQRPREIIMYGGLRFSEIAIGMRLPDARWVNVTLPMAPLRPWTSPTFLVAFLLMTLAAAMLTLWAVRRLTAPVRTLALAAESLGRDVNAPPLPEDGPLEVATAAAAFNTMAARIRRFVQDRTFLLTAIGHDLRTPITRLKLRMEFIDDEELRRKMLIDLDELESMVAATLDFGRDMTTSEPVASVDLPELARTVLDEAADAQPEAADRLTYEGPDHLTARVRPVSLKRALTNLIGNAVAYGGNARVRLSPANTGTVTLVVEDDGPGIPSYELDRVFQPFQRLETSRNRETGGTGLGLPIARNILRAHGGDVILSNRPAGGLQAVVTLPV